MCLTQVHRSRMMTLDNVKQTKALIYSTCHILLLHGTAVEASQTSFDALFELIQRPLTIPATDTEVQKLQMGCIDCLGIFIKTALDVIPSSIVSSVSTTKTPRIEEITDLPTLDNAQQLQSKTHFTDKLTALVNVFTNTKQTLLNLEIDTQFKICIVNAFISSLKMLTPSAVDKLTNVTLGSTEKAIYTSTNAPLKSSYLQVRNSAAISNLNI
jgi:hypothetical protein